jgi:hypothetical protein
MTAQDKVGASDSVEAGLSSEPTGPRYPCPKCGKESKAHNVIEDGEQVKGARICSDRDCREEFNILM